MRPWRQLKKGLERMGNDDSLLLICGCEDKLGVPGELPDGDGAGLQQARQPVPQPRTRR